MKSIDPRDGSFRAARKPHGFVEITGPWGELTTGDVLDCCHCGFTWVVQAGSGRARGWCNLCGGYTCGAPGCVLCVPYEQRLENVEAGRPVLAPRPARASVPARPPPERRSPGGVILP